MQSIQISISDHLLLHVFVKPSNLYQRGPSYWKLNEEILNNNASLIREDLKTFTKTNHQVVTKTLSTIFVTF